MLIIFGTHPYSLGSGHEHIKRKPYASYLVDGFFFYLVTDVYL